MSLATETLGAPGVDPLPTIVARPRGEPLAVILLVRRTAARSSAAPVIPRVPV